MVDFTGAPRVQPSRIRVPGGEATLRSGLPGKDTLWVDLDGTPAGSAGVTFVWPLAFFAATTLGVLIGTFAIFVSGPRRRRWSAFLQVLMKGLPFGLIAAIASTLGLDWFRLQVSDPGAFAAVVVTSALGAWAGRALLEQVTGSRGT
jgi:hypothetical protein